MYIYIYIIYIYIYIYIDIYIKVVTLLPIFYFPLTPLNKFISVFFFCPITNLLTGINVSTVCFLIPRINTSS